MFKFIKYILVTILITLPIISFAEVDRFVFVTDSQNIEPNTISSAITVQSQNNSSNQEDVTETMDIVFNSTSNTGEFLNSSGNAVSKTMSKNTANRTFYYRDSTTGEHTMTLTFTGRDSLKIFTTSQKIKVGNVTNTEPNTPNNQTENTNNSNTNSTNTNNITESAHSSPAPTTGSKDILDFEITAGRDRFTSTGSELTFQSVPTKLNAVSALNINYVWIMGDGTKKEGNIINHKYKFPGEYNVVLNGYFSDKSAVSRIKVLVIEPILNIEIEENVVVIINKSSGEINLGDFILESGVYRFIFPKDTIIGKGKKIIISKELFNIYGKTVILRNPIGSEIAKADKKEQETKTDLIIATTSQSLKIEVKEVTKEVIQAQKPKPVSISIKPKISPKEDQKIETIINATNTAIVYVAKQSSGKINKLLGWFKQIFK